MQNKSEKKTTSDRTDCTAAHCPQLKEWMTAQNIFLECLFIAVQNNGKNEREIDPKVRSSQRQLVSLLRRLN